MSMQWLTSSATRLPLEECFLVQIKILQGYVSHCIDINQPITDYSLITKQQIDQYRVSNEYKVYIKTGIPPQQKPNFPVDSEDPDLTAFKRGIKRDSTHFNAFKRDSDWDEWEAHIKITATGQGVDEILDSTYTPKKNGHCIDINKPITDYGLITQHQIDQYRVSNEYKVYIKTSIPPQ